MKGTLIAIALVCIATGSVLPAAGQIVITAADVSGQLTVGNSSLYHDDSTTTSLNIGSPGGPNSWDFSGLPSNASFSMKSVDPSTTPFIGQFAGATHALQSTVTIEGITGTIYQYLTLSTNLLNPGSMAGATTEYGLLTLKTTNSPSAVTYALPASYGTVWNASYTETQIVALEGTPIGNPTVTNFTDSAWIDAHGTMTVPAGGPYGALRIRLVTHSPRMSLKYLFVAANGASVQATAADTASPNSGVISVETPILWTGPTVVDVAATGTPPAEFSLLQNYPNPFNPTTEITYHLPQASDVRLSVFDLLGQEVALLVSGRESAGLHTVKFNGTGLASGVYFYRLQTATFIQTRRMVLAK